MTNFEAFVNRCKVTGTPVLVQRLINYSGDREVGHVARIKDGVVYIMVGTTMMTGAVNDRTFKPVVVGEWVMTERQFEQMNHVMDGNTISEMLHLPSLPARLCFAAKVLNRPFVVYKRLPSGVVVNDIVESAAENGLAFLKGRTHGAVPLFASTCKGADFWYIDPLDDMIQEVNSRLHQHYTMVAKQFFEQHLRLLPGSRVAVARNLHLLSDKDKTIGLILDSGGLGDSVGYVLDWATHELVWNNDMWHYYWDIVE